MHIRLLHIQNDLGVLVDNFILMITRFHMKQRQFLDAVAITQKNPSNPNLIPPKILYNALDELKNALSTRGLELPIPLSRKTLSQFYKIATPETAIINNTIIITFSIPLISSNHYTLYKTTSLPYRIKGNLFSYIIPNHEYVALDKFKEKYVAITEDEIDQCFQIDSNKLICKQTFPILTAVSTKTCEVNLLRRENISNECDIRIANLTSELWIRLRQPNKYIYVFPHEELMIVKCDEKTMDKHYSDVGIISYGEDCQIKNKNVEIQALKTITTEKIINYTPNITTYINMFNEIENMEKLLGFEIPETKIPQIVNFGEKRKLQDISKNFEELKNIEQHLQLQTTPTHLKNNISILTKSLILIAIITLVIVSNTLRKMYIRKGARATRNKISKEMHIRNSPNIPCRPLPSTRFTRTNMRSTSQQTEPTYIGMSPINNTPIQNTQDPFIAILDNIAIENTES